MNQKFSLTNAFVSFLNWRYFSEIYKKRNYNPLLSKSTLKYLVYCQVFLGFFAKHLSRGHQIFSNFFSLLHKKTKQLNDDIKKIESIKKFEKTLMKVIRTKENSFGVSDIYGIKLFTRLRLYFTFKST